MNKGGNSSIKLIEERINEQLPPNSATPLFADWLHSSLSITEQCNFSPEPIRFPFPSLTKVGLIVALTQHQSQSISLGMNWIKSNGNSSQETVASLRSLYHDLRPDAKINAIINPTLTEINSSIESFSIPKFTKNGPKLRSIFHYVSTNPIQTSPTHLPIFSNDKKSISFFPIETILTSSSSCWIHIIDCNKAGCLLPTYSKFIKDSCDLGNEIDLFAFFSCGPNENLPRSPGLPYALFTSCMTSPAQTALLIHSNHYFCFKDGPLHPFSPDFFSSVSPDIFDEILKSLHLLIEAMAFDVFPRELFVRTFRTDPTVSQLVCNFYLSSRLMGFFGVTPLSFPILPDLRKHHLWDSFDLRLDAAMLQINSSNLQQTSYVSYLDDFLKTLQNLMNATTKDFQFPCLLACISECLKYDSLKDKTFELLAKYIDKSPDSIQQVLCFPILELLFQILLTKSNLQNNNLLFCIIKILSFTNIPFLNYHILNEILFPLFKTEKPLFPLIISTFCICKIEIIRQFQHNWIEFIRPLFKNKYSDVRLWSLLFVYTLSKGVQNLSELLNDIIDLLNDDYPEVRITALYTICEFIGKDEDQKILKSISLLKDDPNPSVRLQLILTLSKFKMCKEIEQLYEFLKFDPYPQVHKQLAIDKSKNISYVYDWMISTLSNPIYDIVKSPEKRIIEVQPIEFNISLTNNNNNNKKLMASYSKLIKGPIISCDSQITSNFSNSGENQFIFGTKNGDISYCVWGAQQKPFSRRLSGTPITHVQYITNYGFPLVFASNTDGYLYALQFSNRAFNLASCFKACSSQFSFECDECQRRLYTNSNGSNVLIYDLQKEKKIGEFKSSYGQIKYIHAIPKVRDVIVVCSDILEFYDTRIGCDSIIQFGIQTHAFDVGTIDRSPTEFALSFTDCSVGLFDIRSTNSLRKYQLAQTPTQALSFAVHSSSASVAIGHENGIFAVDLNNGTKQEIKSVTQLFTIKRIRTVTNCLFHPNRFILSFPQEHEIITLIEDN